MKSTDIIKGISASYSLFFVQTADINTSAKDIISEIDAAERGYKVKIWDFITSDGNPDEVLEDLKSSESKLVILAKNWNLFLTDEYGGINKEFCIYLQNSSELFSDVDNRKVLIILSDLPFEKAIPTMLQREFTSIEFDLPNEEEIKKIYDYVISYASENKKFIVPDAEEEKAILNNSKGMTRREIISAYNYSIIADEGKFNFRTVAKQRAAEIEKTPGLRIGEYDVKENDLKGYDAVKEHALETINDPDALGILLLGPPGTGKTMFCQWLSSQAKKLVLEGEMAELMGEGLVGQAEASMKRFIEVVSANAPCILFIDEIEKGLAGMKSNQSGDGGTTKRSMGQFLKFLSNRPKGVYVVATCNDITSLPPEWVRAERWDTAPFFVDLPNFQEQEAILKHYQQKYGVQGKPKSMEGWSGAEIKACCRLAKMRKKKLEQVEQFILPVSKTMEEEITRLRKWSVNRTIPASTVATANGNKKVKRSLEV